MAKIQIKSEKLTSFGGIFPIMEKFDRMLSHTIDSTLGLRSKVYGYQYSEIIRSLMCVYFCGGSCVEDVSSHLMETLCLHPHLRTCSADTILRAIRELTTPNQSYRSDSGKSYDFNVASDLNNLLVNALLATGQLLPDNEYDFDFYHQFEICSIIAEKRGHISKTLVHQPTLQTEVPPYPTALATLGLEGEVYKKFLHHFMLVYIEHKP